MPFWKQDIRILSYKPSGQFSCDNLPPFHPQAITAGTRGQLSAGSTAMGFYNLDQRMKMGELK